MIRSGDYDYLLRVRDSGVLDPELQRLVDELLSRAGYLTSFARSLADLVTRDAVNLKSRLDHSGMYASFRPDGAFHTNYHKLERVLAQLYQLRWSISIVARLVQRIVEANHEESV